MQQRKVTYKLYPNAKQAAALLELLHKHKNLWNAALEERIDAWRKGRKSISYEDQCASLTQIRGELSPRRCRRLQRHSVVRERCCS